MGRRSTIPTVWWAVSLAAAVVAAVVVWGVAAATSTSEDAPPTYAPGPATDDAGGGTGPVVPPDLDVGENVCWTLEVAEVLATGRLADERRDQLATDVAERLAEVSDEAEGTEADALVVLSDYFAQEIPALSEPSLSTVPLAGLIAGPAPGLVPEALVPGGAEVSDLISDHIDDC